MAWIPDEDIESGQWAAAGRYVAAVSRNSQWWVGDWICCGNARWGERYADAARLTGYDVQSLRNMAHVASRFPPELRRPDLSWSHHAAIAQLEPDEQLEWLARAAELRLSVADLRLEVRMAERVRTAQATPAAGPNDTDLANGAESDEGGAKVEVTCPGCGRQLYVRTDVGTVTVNTRTDSS